MKKSGILIFCALIFCVFQTIACSRDQSLPVWKQVNYENIIATSSKVRPNEVPVKRSKLTHAIEFLEPSEVRRTEINNVIIVLGNMPLDEFTPTIDLVYRVLKGVELAKTNPNSILIMTGGRTAGRVSEAEMMGVIAWSRGIEAKRILLEENSRTTAENAQFSADLLNKFSIDKTFVISKIEHLGWAVPYFKKFPIFKNIIPVDCGVTFEQIVQDMKIYLNAHDNQTVRQRLDNVKRDYKGVD